MTTILNGLLGGLLVGLLAALATRLVETEPSFTATLLERTLGRPATSRRQELLAGVSYGGLAGAAILVLELFVLGLLAVPPTAGEAFGVAIGWSAVLFVLWAVVSQAALSGSDRSHLTELLVYHLVYGLGLGLWIRVTWIT